MTETWLRRTSLAYHAAFDFCASRAACTGGPTIVLASSVFYARELVRRVDGEVSLYLTAAAGLETSEIRAAMGPEIDWGRIRLFQDLQPGVGAGMLLWAEPERDTWPHTQRFVTQLAPTVTQFCVLGTTPLRRVLREWQGDSLPARVPFGSSRPITRALSALYVETARYGFHNPWSLAWSFAGRFAAAIGRDDLVDRCSAAAQIALVVCGWKASWAPVWVVTGSKEGNRG